MDRPFLLRYGVKPRARIGSAAGASLLRGAGERGQRAPRPPVRDVIAAVARPLAPVDRLLLTYIALLASATAWACPAPRGTLLALMVLVLALVAIAELDGGSRAGRICHDFAPAGAVYALFNLSAPAIAAVNPARGDELLARLDGSFFAGLATAWRGALGRPSWLTDVASVAYASFWFLPLVVAIVLYRRSARTPFETFSFGVVTTFLASYVGYFLLPAAGPRIPAGLEHAELGGSAITATILGVLHGAEGNPLDAFPSGHTAVSLVILALAWKDLRAWRIPLAAIVVGIVFSTVYLSFHYVVDLVAGAALAIAIPPLLRPLRRVFAAGPAA